MYASIPTYAPVKALKPLVTDKPLVDKSSDDYEVQPSALAKAFAAMPVMKTPVVHVPQMPMAANTSDESQYYHCLDTLSQKIALAPSAPSVSEAALSGAARGVDCLPTADEMTRQLSGLGIKLRC